MMWMVVSARTFGGSNGIVNRPLTTRTLSIARLALAMLLLGAIAVGPPEAEAVSARGNLSVTVTPDGVSQNASYSIGLFAADKKNPNIAGYTLTFPGDTDVTSASSPGDLIERDIPARTVKVTFGTPIDSQTVKTFSLQLDNIINPSTAGATYQIQQVVFTFTDGSTETVTLPASSAYAITVFSATIGPPLIDFGAVDPDVTTAPQSVTVTVRSSSPYSITRTLGADAPLLGLAVTGDANGVNLPAGTTTYTDAYTITPPWTTEGAVPITTTVIYTIVQ
jgi:hypothetical protein